MFALIDRGLTTVLETKQSVVPVPPGDLAPGKPYWVPLNQITDDQSTGPNTVTEELVTEIFADRVEQVTVIRDKTPAEIATEDDNAASAYLDQDGVSKAIGRILFDLVNDVRVLKGQQPMPVQQFKAYLMTLLRG